MKLRTQITLIILLIFGNYTSSQTASDIFTEYKEYIYQVAYIQPNGDTLTNEKITIQGKGEEWKFDKKQTLLEYTYFPDTVNLKKFVNPRSAYQKRRTKHLKKKNKGKKSWANYTWIDSAETTGKVVRDNYLWIHPPRVNQYAYHYLNAYPEIYFDSLEVGKKWFSKTLIFSGFPSSKEFKGTRIDTFEVVQKFSTNFIGHKLNDCWRIKVKSTHSSKGETTAEYIFSESLGFLEMHNLFYNGVKINYVLTDLVINHTSQE